MSIFGRREKEGGVSTSLAEVEFPNRPPKYKLRDWRTSPTTRQQLAASVHYVALIETGDVPSDPEYISSFYNTLPGDLEGMAPLSTLNAYRRDTGGLASWIADISTVATVIFRVDGFRNMAFAKVEKRIAAATQWKNDVDEALAVGDIARASALLVEPLLTLASAIEEADEQQGTMQNLPMAGWLRADAKRFTDGPDETTGYILSTESASWWGNNVEIWWVNSDLVNNGVRTNGCPTVFDL